MPTPTRTTVAVAIAFVVIAAYAACVIALDASMYGALIEMPHATVVAVVTIALAALGLVHLVWTRGAPSPTFCLLLLFLEVVCVCVLLDMAVDGVAMTTKAIETAPALTTYQHRMEDFLASDKARQYHYSDSLYPHGAAGTPSNPLRYKVYDTREYPLDAARAFSEAYCVSEGHHFCSAFPLVQTIVIPGLWNNPNVTAEVERNLSTLPTTFANVTVTATTTLDSFCARVNITVENPQWDPTTTDPQTFLARLNAPARRFQLDVVDLCYGCAALSNATTKHTALQTWIHDTCPMTAPKPSGAACIQSVANDKKSGMAPKSTYTDFSVDYTYRNPWYDAYFGHTLMSVARNYDRAIAIASVVLLVFLLLLFARVWVVRRAQKHLDALRDTAVHSPVDNA